MKYPFIVFEGADACGKTTLARELRGLIHGEDPLSSQLIPTQQDFLMDTDLHTYLFDFLYDIAERSSAIITTQREKKPVVICRYIDSLEIMHEIYAGTKRSVNNTYIKPDITFYTHTSENIARARLEQRVLEGKKLQPHEADPKIFRKVIQAYNERFTNRSDVYAIDTTAKSIEESLTQIIVTLKQKNLIDLTQNYFHNHMLSTHQDWRL